jgi:hypothetical protein
LYFKLANYEFKVSPEKYISQTWNSNKKYCLFLVQGSNIKKDTIILGDSFMTNYYVYHDVTNKKMGLYGDYMVYRKVETYTIETFIKENIIVVIGVIAGIVLLSICCLFYCCVCRSSGGSENVPLVKGGQPSESLNHKGN